MMPSHNLASRQVSWWETHLFITELTKHVNNLPCAGTPTWCALANDDPRKLLALAVAGGHHVLRVETAQQSLAEASRDISAAADWSAIARTSRQRCDAIRTGAHIPRRAS
jgi:hypothetical protein